MRRTRTLFRLCTGVATAALGLQAVAPALAQPVPPLPSASDASNQDQSDPPARVGRIARVSGTASFHEQGDAQWSPASVNFPVASGDAFWTEPTARMALEIGASRIVLAGGTEFDIATLDPNGLQSVAARGEVWLNLRGLAPDEAWTVTTPRGLVHLNGPGRYAITVGTTDDATLVTVLEGSATMEGPNLSLQIGPGQSAAVTGLETFEGTVEQARRDPFIDEMLAAERPPAPPPSMPPAVASTVTGLPGGVDMMEAGNWAEAPDYGPVWYPPVEPGWVPYRYGHWAYVAPWGWTWIDNAPWGFAPFHYGRWVEVGGRWCWTPADIAVVHTHPVYAPALVAFIGLGAGVAVGAALASHSVGWVPLGPREPFRPWYRASPHYVRQVNVTNVTNNVTINNFINRGATTSVPAAAMVASRPVAPVARPVPPQQLASARPIIGQQPVRPGAATAGVTPATARALGLGPVAHTAPGPTIRPQPGLRSGAPAPAIQTPGAGPGHPAGLAGSAFRPPVPSVQSPPSGPGAAHVPLHPGGTVPPGAVTPQPGFAGRPGVNAVPPAGGPHPGFPQRPGMPSIATPPIATPQGATPGAIPQHAAPLPSVAAPLPSVRTPNPAGATPQHFAAPHGPAPAAPPPHPTSPPQHAIVPQAAPAPVPHHAMPAVVAPQPMPHAPPSMPQTPHFAPPVAAQPHFAAPPAPAPHFAPPAAPAPHAAPPPAEHPKRPGQP